VVIPRHWRPARKAPRILTLVATAISTTQINLSWSVDVGNVGTAGYKVYVDGVLRETLPDVNTLGFPVTGLAPSTVYRFAVAPFDTLGNEYAADPVVSHSTQVPAVGSGAVATVSAPAGLAQGAGAAAGAGASAAASTPAGSASGGGDSTALGLDYQRRLNEGRVVWGLANPDSAAVDQWRWKGGIGNVPTDPDGQVTAFVGNGIRTSCVRQRCPASPLGTPNDTTLWRPMSPFVAGSSGNGLAQPDPAALGALTRRTWNRNNTGQTGSWTNGWYGHPDYHSTGQFDGWIFYWQTAVYISPSRVAPGNPAGKLVFIGFTLSTPPQEVLVQGMTGEGNLRFGMYTNFGSSSNSALTDPQTGDAVTGNKWQPGGAYDATCLVSTPPNPNGEVPNCWFMPTGVWFRLLFEVTPGHHNVTDTGLRVWKWQPGDAPAYTKVWDKQNYRFIFEQGGNARNAWNSIALSHYVNQAAVAQPFWNDFDELLFSQDAVLLPESDRPSAPNWVIA
jgi:hypothetical protein